MRLRHLPRSWPAAAAALAVSTLLAACARGDRLSARDSTFVATMVELRRIPAGPPADSALRQAVLRRRGVTARELEAVAAELADDPARAARVWRRIDQQAAAAPPPPAAPPAAPAAALADSARRPRR